MDANKKLATTGGKIVKLRSKLAAAKLKLKPIEDELKALEDQLLEELIDAKLSSFSTEGARFVVSTQQIAELFDDSAFFEFVRKSKSFDLVRKQVVVSAARARWEDGVEIPGVRPGEVKKLSVTTK